MKLLFLALLFCCNSSTEAQYLNGKWEGIYITIDSSYWDSIKVEFELNTDKSYTVKSYTKGKNKSGKDITIICRLECKLITADSLFLIEKEILAPPGTEAGICFQAFELKFQSGPHRSSPFLFGQWYCDPDKSAGSGFIRLQKISRRQLTIPFRK